jgi:peptide/nickel transport system substrate-binding protein
MGMNFDLNRRTLLKAAAAVPLMTASGMSYAQEATPKRGGHLKIGLAGGSTQDTLDPRTFLDSGTNFVSFTFRNTLTEVSSQTRLAPALAESWEASDGAKKWVFKLRKGVTFHSGKEFNADDALASLAIHIGPDSTSPQRQALSSVTDISAPDKHTLVFTLSSGNSSLAELLADVRIPMMPAKDGKVDVLVMDGTGPYILESWEPGVRAAFKRNENYWNAGAGSYVDSAEILYVADATARMNALRSGEVDIINRVDIKAAALLQRDRNVKVEEVESGQHYIFCMLTDSSPFKDANLRQAMKYGIQRQELIDKVLMGHGSLGNDTVISKFHKYYDASLPQRAYDADKAKYYLGKAGLSQLDITLSVAEAGFPGSSDAAQLFSESARAAGINIQVAREADDGYWSNIWQKRPFFVSYWGHRLTEDDIFSAGYAANAPYNETHWNNARFNELLVSARGELDETKRTDMYHEMQRIMHDDSGTIAPMFVNHIWACKKNIGHNKEVSANWELDGLRCIERWWIDS